jgi:hypothetical protein
MIGGQVLDLSLLFSKENSFYRRNKMKKAVALVLSLMMIFAFTAVFTGCGGGDDEGGEAEQH